MVRERRHSPLPRAGWGEGAPAWADLGGPIVLRRRALPRGPLRLRVSRLRKLGPKLSCKRIYATIAGAKGGGCAAWRPFVPRGGLSPRRGAGVPRRRRRFRASPRRWVEERTFVRFGLSRRFSKDYGRLGLWAVAADGGGHDLRLSSAAFQRRMIRACKKSSSNGNYSSSDRGGSK
jgi:hypothetical protein